MKNKSWRSLNDKDRATLLLKAQTYRRRFCKDGDRLNPLRHIEYDLRLISPFCEFDYLEKIVDEDGFENSAQVVFGRRPWMEISDDVCLTAAHSLRTLERDETPDFDCSAITTLFHEIGHVALHTEKMKKKAGAVLKRGMPNSGTSFRTNPREEEEANVFGGGLQVPVDMIFDQTTPKDLRLRYRMTYEAARRLIDQKRQLAALIEEVRNGLGD